MAFLELDGLQKGFGPNQVVQGVSLAAEQGEFISFLGPSGCGKTTTLRMVAGFESPDAGAIRIEGRDVTGLRPRQRKIGMVFQAYALFPNLTVAENIAFGLKVAGESRAEIAARVREMLEVIHLPELGGRYPFQLSGGQQQRVALARALAVRPKLLLLDEPLSALDAKIRVSLRDEIRAIQRRLGITTIYVTHDQEEALSMSDRILVMNAGRVEQLGAPFEIYNRPATRFVASFVGTLNLIEGVAGPDGVAAGGALLPVAAAAGPVTLALRPEALRLGARPGDARLPGVVEAADFLGPVVRLRVRAAGARLAVDMFNSPAAPPPEAGTAVEVAFAPGDALVLAE